MSDATTEFEDAALHLSKCQDAFQYQLACNRPSDPVERQKVRAQYETAKAELFAAQSRMDKAQRAKYSGSLQ